MPTVVHSLTAIGRAHKNINVPLGARNYDIVIGSDILSEAGRLIATRIGKVKAAIVTDTNVAKFYLQNLEAAVKADCHLLGSIILPAGETTKSFPRLVEVTEKLLDMGLERGDVVIALGGGVIGDLSGFAAGILRRGVKFIQVPTSFLAQVDSSVGGKTGINTRQGKNLVGVFHQPSLVIVDLETLKTLPEREMRAGYAEVIKYGLIQDANFFSWLKKKWRNIFERSTADLMNAVETSIKTKTNIVVHDELETGDRALLNLGHTFGHALEALTGFSEKLLHGEAVALGMGMAFRFSEELGLCPAGTAKEVTDHIQEVGLPAEIKQIPTLEVDPKKFMQLMAQDKKVKSGKLTFILVNNIGKAFIAQDVEESKVGKFLEREISK